MFLRSKDITTFDSEFKDKSMALNDVRQPYPVPEIPSQMALSPTPVLNFKLCSGIF